MSIKRRDLLQNSAFATALAALSASCGRPDQQGASDLAALDGVETAARIRNGELSAAEAVDAAIERAKRIEPKINAIVTKTFKAARAAAGEAHSGPFAGVPSFIKDLDDLPGVHTGFGSRSSIGYKGTETVPLIDAFLDLGVVSLGKSATPEYGLSATTEPMAGKPTRNPWNLDHSTGGSSGGAAALVASGVVPIAHASDGGGSIRIPASCCGNVGLKVSRGRNPAARPEKAGPLKISVHGAQTRTVRDTAAVIAGLELPADISGLPPIGLVEGPRKERLRIGVFDNGVLNDTLDPEVKAANERTAALLAELGHEVVEWRQPFGAQLGEDFVLYWAAFAKSIVETWEEASGLSRNGLLFEPFTLGLIEHLEARMDRFDDALRRLQASEAEFDEALSQFDAVLSPVTTAPPPPIGYLDGKLEFDVLVERLTTYVQYTGLYNVTGAPAISLPLSMSEAGLPIGSMLGARLGRERVLIELAYELEEAAPWAGRRPPVFG